MLHPYGYRLSSRYIIKEKHKIHNKAMEAEILKDNVFRVPATDLAKDSLFYNTRMDLQRSFRLFKFSNESYITEQVIERSGISNKDLERFVQEAIDFIKSNPGVYTYEKLVQKGFENKLQNLGFENVFYESLIVQHNDISYLNTKPNIFYINNGLRFTYSDFLYNELKKLTSVDYQDMIDFLGREYGINIDFHNLKWKLNSTEAYYSKETEKFYIDKEQYFLEVYGE